MTMTWPIAMQALVTAFDDDGEIDIDNHRHNLLCAIDAGTSGVLIGGSTGEGPYLEPGERNELIRVAREVSPDLTILCGVFAESSRSANAQVMEAADSGANAILVVTPTTLMRNRDSWVVEYFEWVADLSPLPAFLYSVPAVTGYELPCESVAELAGHPNIVGMKDSGGDVQRLVDIAAILSDDFIVYTGKSTALAASFERGAYGAITASANYAFSSVAAASQGDLAAQATLTEVTAVVERHGVPGTKFAASVVGMRPGKGRGPLPELSIDVRDTITTTCRALVTNIW
ncbi:MAG: dihydrodipicolinate synthase family protein [Actinomycetia bacterium]|nr:dihydrodipicolinate synthase family protein [Actinomycetes bacterium]